MQPIFLTVMMLCQSANAAQCVWQEGGDKPEVGAAVSGRVLDVSKADGIVDLSLAAALLPPAGGKKKEPKGDKWKVGRASFSAYACLI